MMRQINENLKNSISIYCYEQIIFFDIFIIYLVLFERIFLYHGQSIIGLEYQIFEKFEKDKLRYFY